MSKPSPPPIPPILVAALSRPSQTTLTALIAEYGWIAKDILEALNDLNSILKAWDIECVPPIGEYGLDDVRIVRRATNVDPLELTVADLARGEGAGLEFKESLVLDVKKHVLGKQPIERCFSNEVINACLKTVAAYLNGTGGTLLVGVADDGSVVGLEREFALIPGSNKRDFDEWELFFRSMIEKSFHNGRSISASVQINRVNHEQGIVARVVTGPRRELCVMKASDGDKLFVRTGNRTLSVSLADFEQFFSVEKKYL